MASLKTPIFLISTWIYMVGAIPSYKISLNGWTAINQTN